MSLLQLKQTEIRLRLDFVTTLPTFAIELRRKVVIVIFKAEVKVD